MKKLMIVSGGVSVSFLSIGIILKYMHAAGSGLLISIGILIAGFIFMPALFGVKVSEKTKPVEKLLVGISTLTWMSAIIGVLFKVQHWPGATLLFYCTPFLLLLAYLPLYFFSGIASAATRVNTIAYSVLIVISCGLFFTLTATPIVLRLADVRNTQDYLRGEEILKYEQKLLEQQPANTHAATDGGNKIFALCSDIKSLILSQQTGYPAIGQDFESKDALIPYDRSFEPTPAIDNKLDELAALMRSYNASNGSLWQIPFAASMINNATQSGTSNKINVLLNELSQVQLIILQNMGSRK